jgi:ADP-ribose 1''-phosphate phosphatase
MITYRRMSLFDAPEKSYIVHACNSMGVWGSGIAVEFKRRFPHAFAVYERNVQGSSQFILGQFWAIWDNNYYVTCLMVSLGYGRHVDPPESILKHTRSAVEKLISYLEREKVTQVYSNKFNSGFFKVPWPRTEAILVELLKDKNIEWIVCDPQHVETCDGKKEDC